MTKPKRTPPSPPARPPAGNGPAYTPSPPEAEALHGYLDLGGHVIVEGV